MLSKLKKHLERGTLLEALQYKLGRLPLSERTRWYGARTLDEGVEALARRAQRLLGRHSKKQILVIGDGGTFQQLLEKRLSSRQMAWCAITPDAVENWTTSGDKPGLILCGLSATRQITTAGRAAARNPRLAEVPFEYASGLDAEQQYFRQHDQYADTFFMAPQLLEPHPVYDLYDESLKRFEQKCGLRDFLDFSQCISHVLRERIPGDIAEFGSYRGHSGWLMANLLRQQGSDKTLHLFDAFEHFPSEDIGVDYFWSQTHHVNFDEVRGKFTELSNVRFVKGDFTRTLATSGIRELSMAYIDCDSLRATRYLIDTILDDMLAPGGLLVIEDYGHPALLGSRIAVHETLDARHDLFRFFSQFSGLYIAVKLPKGN